MSTQTESWCISAIWGATYLRASAPISLFEMSPVDQHISDEVFKTDLLNMWVKDPSGPVSMLMRARMELDKAWRKRFGLALFRPFHRADEGILEQIHIPSGNGEPEFEAVIMALTRALSTTSMRVL